MVSGFVSLLRWLRAAHLGDTKPWLPPTHPPTPLFVAGPIVSPLAIHVLTRICPSWGGGYRWIAVGPILRGGAVGIGGLLEIRCARSRFATACGARKPLLAYGFVLRFRRR